MASWYVNKGLAVLIALVKALFPGITVYTIGDASHSARKSDHNPNSAGRVNAADFMLRGPFKHAQAVWLCAWLILDPRTKYVIFNRRIWQDGHWSDYGGDNPHTDHVHLSVFDSANGNTSPWKESRKLDWKQFTISMPILRQGDNDDDFGGYDRIKRIQKLAGTTPDGDWGPATTKALGYNVMTVDRYHDLFGLGKVD